MNQQIAITTNSSPITVPALAALIDDAAKILAGAQSAAEVLDARDMAAAAYDHAKSAARLAAARCAHDDIVARIHRAQARALEIEAAAKHRLADEYDAAQARGEVATKGKPVNVPDENIKAKVTDLGLTRKQVHEAREIRDAEQAEPGIVHRVVTEAIEAGEEPTKAKVRKAVQAKSKGKQGPKKSVALPTEQDQHHQHVDMLQLSWDLACASARASFLHKAQFKPMENEAEALLWKLYGIFADLHNLTNADLGCWASEDISKAENAGIHALNLLIRLIEKVRAREIELQQPVRP